MVHGKSPMLLRHDSKSVHSQNSSPPRSSWSSHRSGAVYSTVRDLWQWRKELLAGRVLGAGAVKEIFGLRPFGYSFGWHVGRTSPTQLRIFLANDYDARLSNSTDNLLFASHSGDPPGFHSRITMFPDGIWTVILLDNHDSKSLPNLVAELINAILTRTPEADNTIPP